MGVLVEHWIPDTPPAKSTIEWFPLAGDGETAPLGMYAVDVNADGDASGDPLQIVVHPDERYTTMPAYMTAKMSGAANQDYWMQAVASDGDRFEHYGALQVRSPGGTSVAISTCRIPPFLMPPRRQTRTTLESPYFFFQSDNPGATYSFRLLMRLFCFGPDVRNKVAYPILAANLPS